MLCIESESRRETYASCPFNLFDYLINLSFESLDYDIKYSGSEKRNFEIEIPNFHILDNLLH